MENQRNLSNSSKKHIRLQKSLIRRNFSDAKKQEELIVDLYKKYSPDQIIFAKQKLKSSQDFILPGEGDTINKEPKKEESPKPLGHRPTGEAIKEVKKNKLEKKYKKNEVQKN